MIEMSGVSKEYRNGRRIVRALDGIDLEIPEGHFAAIKGPSGCGKSTLLMIVGAMLQPTAGKVLVCGRELATLSGPERALLRADQIGFVFQMFHLVPYLTVFENVILAGGGRGRRPERGAVDGILARFGLSDRSTHLPGELSAGERQRVALARALVLHPPVVLADEPTGNLDPGNAAEVVRILADYRDDGGTVMMVTHSPVADEVADKVVHLGGPALVSG